MKNIRIAAVIINSQTGKTEANLNRMAVWVSEAKKQGAALICFPEMNVTGYTSHKNVLKTAEAVPGRSTAFVSDMAKKENIVILAGLAEMDNAGCVYASHVVALPDGRIETYRKLHLAPPEKGIFTPGENIPIFETCGIRFGIQLCYDAHFPELSAHMAVKGADILFFPHASPRGTPDEKYASWMRHLPARAYDNSVFVVACNQSGDNGGGLSFPGVAVVIAPSGNVMEHRLEENEGMLVTDLKGADLDAVREHRMKYFLPNRRPEIYQGH